MKSYRFSRLDKVANVVNGERFITPTIVVNGGSFFTRDTVVDRQTVCGGRTRDGRVMLFVEDLTVAVIEESELPTNEIPCPAVSSTSPAI